MYSRLTALLLRWLRVPPEPQPPHGEPASLRVFRAGQNFLYLRLFGWGVTQLLALAGIIFWVSVFITVEAEVQVRRQSKQEQVSLRNVKSIDDFVQKVGAAAPEDTIQATPPADTTKITKSKKRVHIDGWTGFKRMLVESALWLPTWSFPLLWALKIAGILVYLLQLPITYAIRRLDYEQRWYMVTDRSLRIRYGVWNISESTMSFANIQQVVVSQNPIQRLLGLSDVKVQSAGGGGGGDKHEPSSGDDMHLGLFHQVTNGSEIRDLILKRLRRFRESGLGDPDEKAHAGPDDAPPIAGQANALVTAARELATEARALRLTL
jgi:membrane protein YdbS with pleckstrin-like domain